MKPMAHSTKMSHDDKPTFQGWLVRVDAHLLNMTGLISADFPDQPLQKWFESRMLPEVAAENILKKA
jgi:hypothetical protein